VIRRSLRFGIRLGLLTGIALALFKLVQSRRSASELGRPSDDWAPPPPPNVPKPPPEPELVEPVILEELKAKKAAERVAPADSGSAPPAGSAARAEQAPAPNVAAATGEPVVKKASPAKRAAAKKAGADEPSAAAPVKKAAAKKAPAKKAPAQKGAAKKAAPAKKATKKTQ
jgi:valyl-tRNA synthetase